MLRSENTIFSVPESGETWRCEICHPGVIFDPEFEIFGLTRDFISYRLWESSTNLGTSTFEGPENEYEIFFLAWSLVGSKNVLKNRGRNTALINPPAATFRQQLCSKVVDSSLHSECFGEIIGRFKPAPVYFFFSFLSQ